MSGLYTKGGRGCCVTVGVGLVCLVMSLCVCVGHFQYAGDLQ